MKILNFVVLCTLLAVSASAQVNVQQAPGTYTDNSIPRRDGTGNKVENTAVIITDGNVVQATQLESTVATGTPPLVVASTTEVANLRANTATAAYNVVITDNNTLNSSVYPAWSSGISSSEDLVTSSTKLSFVPLSGILTAGGFAGPHNGTVGATTPTTSAFTTSTASTSYTSPIFSSNNADPADAGIVRLGNAETIAWEASPASTDLTLTVNSSEQFAFSAPILSPDIATSITTASTSFTAFAGATTLMTIGGTGASASSFFPSTLDTSSSTTGAIRTSGGISAAKALNIGTTATIGGDLTVSGGDITIAGASTITGGAGNMQITSGTGNSRTMALRTTTSGGTATTALTLGADQSATFAGVIGLLSSASPTTTAAQMAFDNNAWATNFGAVQVHNGTANTFLVGVTASDTPSNGQVPTWNTGGGITWETPSGSGTVTVVGAGSLTSTALVTGGGTTTLQTPAATATMDSSGNISTPGTLSIGTGASTAGAMVLSQGTTQSAGTTNITIQAPAAVTSHIYTLPATVGTNGAFWTQTTSGTTATIANSKAVPTGTVVGTSDTQTLTNKWVQARVTTITSNATPTVNTDATDVVSITALAAAITSMTTNLSGSPQPFDQLEYWIVDDGTPRTIAWGASFSAGAVALPTTTVTSKPLHVYFERNPGNTAWACMATMSDP